MKKRKRESRKIKRDKEVNTTGERQKTEKVVRGREREEKRCKSRAES